MSDEADAVALLGALGGALSPSQPERQAAEASLGQAEQNTPGKLLAALLGLHRRPDECGDRWLLVSIYLKNAVTRRWAGLGAGTREQCRGWLVEQCNSELPEAAHLAETIAVVAEADWPDRWPGMPEALAGMAPTDCGLECVCAVLKRVLSHTDPHSCWYAALVSSLVPVLCHRWGHALASGGTRAALTACKALRYLAIGFPIDPGGQLQLRVAEWVQAVLGNPQAVLRRECAKAAAKLWAALHAQSRTDQTGLLNWLMLNLGSAHEEYEAASLLAAAVFSTHGHSLGVQMLESWCGMALEKMIAVQSDDPGEYTLCKAGCTLFVAAVRANPVAIAVASRALEPSTPAHGRLAGITALRALIAECPDQLTHSGFEWDNSSLPRLLEGDNQVLDWDSSRLPAAALGFCTELAAVVPPSKGAQLLALAIHHASNNSCQLLRVAAVTAIATQVQQAAPEIRAAPNQRRRPLLDGQLDAEIAQCLLRSLQQDSPDDEHCLAMLEALIASLVRPINNSG